MRANLEGGTGGCGHDSGRSGRRHRGLRLSAYPRPPPAHGPDRRAGTRDRPRNPKPVRLPRAAAPHRAPRGRARLPRSAAGRDRRGDGLGLSPLPRVLLRDPRDGRGAAHHQRAALARSDPLHHQPRGGRRHPRARGFHSAGRADPRSDRAQAEAGARARRRRRTGAGSPARLRGRLPVTARPRPGRARVPRARRAHARDDVLHHGDHGRSEGGVVHPPPARAAHAGRARGDRERRRPRAAAPRRRLHADQPDVPRPRVGHALRRHPARGQAGLSRALRSRRRCCGSSSARG